MTPAAPARPYLAPPDTIAPAQSVMGDIARALQRLVQEHGLGDGNQFRVSEVARVAGGYSPIRLGRELNRRGMPGNVGTYLSGLLGTPVTVDRHQGLNNRIFYIRVLPVLREEDPQVPA